MKAQVVLEILVLYCVPRQYQSSLFKYVFLTVKHFTVTVQLWLLCWWMYVVTVDKTEGRRVSACQSIRILWITEKHLIPAANTTLTPWSGPACNTVTIQTDLL